MKLESVTASSPGIMGGMSAGKLSGSKVRVAMTGGCLMIVGAAVILGCCEETELRHRSQAKRSTPSKEKSTMNRRKDKTASRSILQIKLRASHEFSVGDAGKDTGELLSLTSY